MRSISKRSRSRRDGRRTAARAHPEACPTRCRGTPTPAGPGRPGEGGGAIRNAAGDLELVEVILADNVAGLRRLRAATPSCPARSRLALEAAGGEAGRSLNSGTLTIRRSLLSERRSAAGGGPGSSADGPLRHKRRAGGGGAISNTGTLTIASSTLSDNRAAPGNPGPTNTISSAASRHPWRKRRRDPEHGNAGDDRLAPSSGNAAGAGGPGRAAPPGSAPPGGRGRQPAGRSTPAVGTARITNSTLSVQRRRPQGAAAAPA